MLDAFFFFLSQQNEEVIRKREASLRQHSFFQLKVHLVSGINLVPMDRSGTSDPYVKFKLGSRLLYKSKTVHKDLNPSFDEVFTVPIEDPFQPVNIKVNLNFRYCIKIRSHSKLLNRFSLFNLQVFDYDWGLQDDFMGATKLTLTQLELNQSEEIYLKLTDPARPLKDLGELKLIVTLLPKTQEDKEQVIIEI